MKITYLGHSAFEIKTNKDCIIIDPYLVCSPNYNYNDVTNIFVTHGHGDHLGSAFNISRKTNAPITAIFEYRLMQLDWGQHLILLPFLYLVQ